MDHPDPHDLPSYEQPEKTNWRAWIFFVLFVAGSVEGIVWLLHHAKPERAMYCDDIDRDPDDPKSLTKLGHCHTD